MHRLDFTKYIIQYTVERNCLSVNNLLESLVIARSFTTAYLYFYTGGVANKIFYKIIPDYIYIYCVTSNSKATSGYFSRKFYIKDLDL